VPGGVQQGERRTGGVSEQVDSVQPQVDAQRFDIVDQPITPVARRVRRCGRGSGSAQVQQHQRAMRGQPAQVTEVGRGLHGAAGNTHQRVTRTGLAVGELRAVGTIEGCHAEIICADIRVLRRASRTLRPTQRTPVLLAWFGTTELAANATARGERRVCLRVLPAPTPRGPGRRRRRPTEARPQLVGDRPVLKSWRPGQADELG
jgi:hypothetical protein